MPQFSGTVTTSGNSEAIRFERALFKAHPEFRRDSKVVAQIIAPGHMLVSVAHPAAKDATDSDPVIDAFLAFLGADIVANPHHIARLDVGTITRARALTRLTSADDGDHIPEDVTL